MRLRPFTGGEDFLIPSKDDDSGHAVCHIGSDVVVDVRIADLLAEDCRQHQLEAAGCVNMEVK